MDEQPLTKKQKRELKRKKENKQAIIFLVYILLVLPLIPAFPYIWGLAGFHLEVSEGYRVGQVVKLSHKGILWKTWEGTMGLTQSGAYLEKW